MNDAYLNSKFHYDDKSNNSNDNAIHCRGAMVQFSVRTRNTRVVSSNPVRVTIKTPLMRRKATGDKLIKSASLEKLRDLSMASATLEIEYANKRHW